MTPPAPRASAGLRPLGLGELLDAAIKVCTTHAWTLARAVLVVVLPVQVISALVLLSTVSDPHAVRSTFSTTDTAAGDAGAYFAGQAVITVLSLIAYLLSTGACFQAIGQAWLGGTPDWRTSLRFAARRAPALLGTLVLYSLGLVLGFVLLIVPGVYLFVAWALATPIVLVERRSGASALGRSRSLVQGHWWRTLGVLLVGYIIAGVLGGLLNAAAGAVASTSDAVGFAVLAHTLASIVSALLTTPFRAAVIVLVYFDLRVRKEGFDLELLAERLSGGDPDRDVLAGVAEHAPAVAGVSRYTEEERAQAPFWPPPPGWKPAPAHGDDLPDEPWRSRPERPGG